jgi:hypothetical protein
MYRFQVTGKGDFPFSMLAASKAYPVDGREAHKMALSCPTVAPEQNIWLESTKQPNSRLWAMEKWPVTAMTS